MGKNKGFTLIELLITISIIAVLSTIGMIIYQSVQSKAQDSTRKSDLNKLATALEIYYQQNYKFVVNSDGSDLTACPNNASSWINSVFYNSIRNSMSDQNVPADPDNGWTPYCYISSSISSKTGQAFRLFAKLKNSDNANLSGCTTYNYSVVSDNLALACPP